MATDLLASAILGTKSSISSFTGSEDDIATGTAAAHVTLLSKKITYKLGFGIPAFLVLLLWVLICLVAFLFWITTTVTPQRLRRTLNDTAAGRVVTSFIHPELCDPGVSTDEWVKRAGHVRLIAPYARNEVSKSIGETQGANIREREGFVSGIELSH
jgi:hypothetical protein